MQIEEIKNNKNKIEFNKLAKHPLQAWEWGEFRKKTGVKITRWGVFENKKLKEVFQVSIHSLPLLPFTVGYLPKSSFPDDAQKEILNKIAKRYKCIYIKTEPIVEAKKANSQKLEYLKSLGLVKGRPLFTKYNFVIDLNKSEEELLKNMKSKTRYNLRYAKRKGVIVKIDNSSQAFEQYLKLVRTTTERQGFYSHGEEYHRKMWESLKNNEDDELKATLMKASYKGDVLVAWILFEFGNTLYYPYGASSNKMRNLMASNLVMWEAIRYGKKKGYRYFDMWGALGENPNKNHAWYGFHKFKEGYGAKHVEYIGTYDYVANPALYKIFTVLNSIRWFILRLIKK